MPIGRETNDPMGEITLVVIQKGTNQIYTIMYTIEVLNSKVICCLLKVLALQMQQ